MIFEQRRQLWYAPILAASVALTLLRLMLLAHILDVPNFALVSAGVLIAGTYTMLSCLGLYMVLLRDLPMFIVRGRERRGSVLMVQALLVATACAAVSLLLAPLVANASSIPVGIVMLGIGYGLTQEYFLVVNTDCRSRGQLIRYAKENLARALAVLVAGITTAALGGSAYLVLAAESTVAMALVLASSRSVFSVSRVRWRNLVQLAAKRIGHIPWRSAQILLLNSFLGFLVLSSDRWLAASMIDTAGFAQYSFVAIVLVCAQAIQGIIGSAVFPALARRKGQFGMTGTFRLCAQYSLGTLGVASALVLPTWFMVNAVIVRWYPAYANSGTLLWLLLGVALLRVSDFWSTNLVVVNRENLLLTLNAAATVGGFCLWLAWIWLTDTHQITSTDVGIFALCLTGTGYLVLAIACWRVHRASTKTTDAASPGTQH